MTNILQISNYFYPNIGGIEQVARDIAGSFSECGDIQQKLICFNETASDGNHSCRREETVHEMIDGIEIIRCGCIVKKASQSISLTFGRELDQVMREFQPDIVIFHYPNPFEAFFLNQYLRKPFQFVLYWHLDIVKQKILGKLFHGQTMRLLKRADRIVATSPLYIDGSPYLSQFREKCIVIPNCISETRMKVTDEIRKRAEEIRKENEGHLLCFGVGRHIPYKGFTYLVQASRELDDRFRIVIGGKGELSDSLKEEASGDSKIMFPGRVSEEDLIAYYLAMDIFCFPSVTKNEAFGIALAEGMYFGKPAVTFHIPGSGVNFVSLKDVTGLEVPNGDSRAYASALRKLADNPELRKQLGKAASMRVNDLFLMDRFQEEIRELVGSLQKGRKTE